VFTNICCAIGPFGADNLTGAGFSLSSNMGANWSEVSNGLPSDPRMSSIAISSSGGNFNYYAGLFENSLNGAKVFKMSIPIGIQPISNNTPAAFSLSQNYPNPFNPSAKIRFSIPYPAEVRLSVFDILGREISVLVNEKLIAGTYESDWNAKGEAGGVYFYRLEAEGYSETKKMLMVK